MGTCGEKNRSVVIPDTESGKVEEMIIVLIKSQISDLTPKEILTIWEFYMNDVRSYYVELNLAIIQDVFGNQQIYINTGKKCKCRAYYPWKNK